MTLLIDCFVGDDPMLLNVGKSIIQRNDSTSVTALYKDSNGSGVSGERVYFFSDNNYLGYGDSNEYGIAKLEYDSSGSEIDGYVGQGNGRIGIMAADSNPVTSGSVVSEPYTVYDCFYLDTCEDNTKLSNYQLYGDTVKSIENGKLKLVTGNSQYWTLIRWGGTYSPISEVQGKTVTLECDFECSQEVTFESNVNNVLQDTTTNGKVSMTVPNDATACYFGIKSQNTTIYVDNIRLYFTG